MMEQIGSTADDAHVLSHRAASQIPACVLPCRDAAQARVAELEGQVEAMIEQIGCTADEAVVRLERDVSRLREELHAAEKESEQAHAMAKEAVGVLESTTRERDTVRLQVGMTRISTSRPFWDAEHSIVQCAGNVSDGSELSVLHRPDSTTAEPNQSWKMLRQFVPSRQIAPWHILPRSTDD